MENASKALIMAGSVLIALLIISLLVVFYNNIKYFQNVNHSVDVSEQIAEFNKQYDVYYRDNLYGSDLLSIANKVVDYNKRESDTDGYTKLEARVVFTNESIKIKASGGTYNIDLKIGKSYNSEDIKNVANQIEYDIETLGQNKEYGKAISKLAIMRDNELKENLKIDYDDNSNPLLLEVRKKISDYQSYKSALSTLKSKTFKASGFEYDKKTGRITLMKFEEI